MTRLEGEIRCRELWSEAYASSPSAALEAAESVLGPHGLICEGTFVYANIPTGLLLDFRVALMVLILESRG